LNISETVRDDSLKALVPKGHQQEMNYGESNGHVTDDGHVTPPHKVKLMTLIRLEPNSRKRLEIEIPFQFQRTTIGNGLWVSNGHMTDDIT